MTLPRIGTSPAPAPVAATPEARAATPAAPAAPVTRPGDGFGQPAPASNAIAGASRVSAPAVDPYALPSYSVNVKHGDTYWGLGIRFGEYAPVLGGMNKDPGMTRLHPGEQLVVPGWKTYTVHAGDTLSAIAREFGTNLKTLVKANQIKDPDVLLVGQKLAVPVPDTRDGQAEATAVAHELGLGRLIGSEGAAGTLYLQFEKGTVRYSNPTGQVAGVELKDPVNGGTIELPKRVLDTAMFGLLGKFKGAEGAAGHTYFAFDRAAVDWSNVTGSVNGVQWPDGRFTQPDQDAF